MKVTNVQNYRTIVQSGMAAAGRIFVAADTSRAIIVPTLLIVRRQRRMPKPSCFISLVGAFRMWAGGDRDSLWRCCGRAKGAFSRQLVPVPSPRLWLLVLAELVAP
jgi:hypothetical protein